MGEFHNQMKPSAEKKDFYFLKCFWKWFKYQISFKLHIFEKHDNFGDFDDKLLPFYTEIMR